MKIAAQDIAGLASLPEAMPSAMLGSGNLSAAVSTPATFVPKGWSFDILPRTSSAVGGGVDPEPAHARLKAVAEALERSCLTTLPTSTIELATARGLGKRAFDWSEVPACSTDEYAHPDCPVIPFDPDRKMRWINGIRLSDGCSTLVPASMVYLTPPLRRAEQFLIPISTGAAIHTDPATAIVSACLEVIERDSLALNWLTQKRLKRISIFGDPKSDAIWSVGTRGLEQYFFDATTDIGIPVVYSLQKRTGSDRVATLVTAACNFQKILACRKAAAEAISTRGAVASSRTVLRIEDCTRIEHGAAFMGMPERTSAFNFLFERLDTEMVEDTEPQSLSPSDQLNVLKDTFARKGVEAYVVPIATRAVRSLSLHAFKVVIPSLMPLSYHYRARFLAHKRLVKLLSVSGSSIAKPNHWPQPFA